MRRKFTFALLALILAFAGCKSESPTAPPLGAAPGSGVTPPVNATLTLTASNSSPVVNSQPVITATVTSGGQSVPNGTAVQFTTNFGTFSDPGTTCTTGSAPICTVLKTTTNGVATAMLTASTPGPATVTAVVNNVSKSITVTFGAQGGPQPGSTTPTISAVTPSSGLPAGGLQVTITGTNFVTPIRVLFDIHDGSPKEAFVAQNTVTPTSFTVLTPAINLVTAQTQAADVIVITQAGTGAEQRVVDAGGFTYAVAVLTPDIRALQPTSGPVDGGTRITIIGDAFQAPVQVFFGAAEAQVLSVNFSQIIVMSPKASDTAPDASGVVTGPVDIRVVNVNSNKSVTFSGGFRYIPKMQITTVTNNEGPFSGGTRVRIDGSGFDQPLAVTLAGVGAQVISVSGTEIVAISSPIQLTSCGDVTGAIVVTNTNNGDSASFPTFIYRVPKALITNISNPNNLGGTATITVLNALGFARITIGGVGVTINSSTTNPDGTTTFTVQLPPTIQLSTVSCPAGGSAPTATAFDVQYTSATTGCTDTSVKGITINPAAAPVLFANPIAFQAFTATITPQAAPPLFPGTTVTPSAPQTLQVVNNGTSALNLNSITTVGAGCPDFVFGPAVPPIVTLNECESLPVTVSYKGQLSPVTETCTLTVTSNAGTKTLLLVGSSQ